MTPSFRNLPYAVRYRPPRGRRARSSDVPTPEQIWLLRLLVCGGALGSCLGTPTGGAVTVAIAAALAAEPEAVDAALKKGAPLRESGVILPTPGSEAGFPFAVMDSLRHALDRVHSDLDGLLRLSQHSHYPGETPRFALLGGRGMGKTSLAAKVAQDNEVRSHYPGGILWTTLESPADEPHRSEEHTSELQSQR